MKLWSTTNPRLALIDFRTLGPDFFVFCFDDFQYFESDDKDLYRSKIKYIEETDPEDLGLVFSEEEYDRHGRLERVREWTFVLHRE